MVAPSSTGAGGPYVAAIGIRADRIAKIENLNGAIGKKVIDATHKIVSPGYIDMLGQSKTALLIDNPSLSKLSQGITSEITVEGVRPLHRMKKHSRRSDPISIAIT